MSVAKRIPEWSQAMGLDAVEIVMEVEDKFAVSIRDDEASKIVTVGDLENLVIARINARQLNTCPTLSAFLRIRSDIRQLIPDASARIRPRQQIASAIPRHKRRIFWKQIEKRLGTYPPPLRRPFLVRALLAIATILFI